MSIDFYWRLPTHGCHNSLQTSGYERGDWSPLVLMATACVLNYLAGEMWNHYSTAANPNFWKYDVPVSRSTRSGA